MTKTLLTLMISTLAAGSVFAAEPPAPPAPSAPQPTKEAQVVKVKKQHHLAAPKAPHAVKVSAVKPVPMTHAEQPPVIPQSPAPMPRK